MIDRLGDGDHTGRGCGSKWRSPEVDDEQASEALASSNRRRTAANSAIRCRTEETKRAQELVRQIKLQMGVADAEKANRNRKLLLLIDKGGCWKMQSVTVTGKEKGKTLDSKLQPGELPDKTIGRIPGKKS